jgi:hypothetical protein
MVTLLSSPPPGASAARGEHPKPDFPAGCSSRARPNYPLANRNDSTRVALDVRANF